MTSLSVVNAGGADCDDADPDPAGGGGAPFVVVVVEDMYFTRFALGRRMKEESNAPFGMAGPVTDGPLR